jgi:TRAP-type mannitol/chloroaromatic compound transport system permease small subunit
LFKKVIRALDRAIEGAAYYGLLVSGILILVMSWLSTYGVARRYLLNNPEPYSYEISTSMLLACVVFSIAYLQRQGQHLRADFLSIHFSQATQAVITDIVGPIVALFYIGIITWQSWDAALYSLRIYETSQSSWEEPLFPTKLVVPIGMGLLCLVLLAQLSRGVTSLVQRIRGVRKNATI